MKMAKDSHKGLKKKKKKNHCVKRRNSLLRAISPFSQCIQKAYIADT